MPVPESQQWDASSPAAPKPGLKLSRGHVCQSCPWLLLGRGGTLGLSARGAAALAAPITPASWDSHCAGAWSCGDHVWLAAVMSYNESHKSVLQKVKATHSMVSGNLKSRVCASCDSAHL